MHTTAAEANVQAVSYVPELATKQQRRDFQERVLDRRLAVRNAYHTAFRRWLRSGCGPLQANIRALNHAYKAFQYIQRQREAAR